MNRHRAPEPTEEPLLSPRRAFVLQFYPKADVAEGVFLGRAEHVVSGRSVRFASFEELVVFLARTLPKQS